MFQGYVQLESDLGVISLAKNGNAPVQLDAAPTYRVYGPGGLMQNGTGTASSKDTGSITAASNAAPVSITSTAHGLATGTEVTVSGVVGNTGANGTFKVVVSDANTFTLTGSTGNSAYVSGGTWSVTGLYQVTVSATSANGYLAGETYCVLLSGAISAAAWADLLTFTVV